MDSDSTDSEFFEDEIIERNHYMFRERMDWAIFSPAIFKENFRCSPAMAELLLQLIGADIQPKFYRNHALRPKERLLIALRFLADNDDMHAVAASEHVSRTSVFNMIKIVISAIIRRLGFLIDWPADAECRRNIAQQFFHMSVPGVPNVCGALDGTLVPIVAPSVDEMQYIDRHQGHSINVMAVAGPDMYFYSFSCRWPGGLHDARVLRNSGLFAKFQNGWRPFQNAVILADSAYPRNDWIVPMQRIVQPQFAALFNAHQKTRRIVENAFGLLKARFQCCQRKFKFKNPAKSAVVIKCCAILHNFFILNSDQWDFQAIPIAEEDFDAADLDDLANAGNDEGLQRITILNHLFQQLNNL